MPSDACSEINPVDSETTELIERGGCSFADKIVNAKKAGASAVVIYNSEGLEDEDNTNMICPKSGVEVAGRLDPVNQECSNVIIPAVFIKRQDSLDLTAAINYNSDLNLTFTCPNSSL